MNEAIFVQKVDAGTSLNEKVKGSFLIEAAFFLDENEEVTLGHILHDQVYVLSILQISIHSDYIHMLELFVDLNLSSQRFLHLRCRNFALIQLLNRYFDAAGLVEGQLDGTV